MGNLTEYQMAEILISVFSFLSCICSLFLIVQILYIWFLPIKVKKRPTPLVIYFHVFYMSLCDVAWSVIMFDQFGLVSLLQVHAENDFTCRFLGNLGIYFQLASASWYFMICIVLYKVLDQTSVNQLYRSKHYQHAFVWGLSGLVLLIGNLTDGVGSVHKKGGIYTHCFLTHDSVLLFYGPIFFYMLFAGFILIRCWCFFQALDDKPVVMGRIMLYVVVFVATWIIPTFNSFCSIVGIELPSIFALLYTVGMSAGGFGNFLVWINSESFDREGLQSQAQHDSFDLVYSENSATTITINENAIEGAEKLSEIMDCRTEFEPKDGGGNSSTSSFFSSSFSNF